MPRTHCFAVSSTASLLRCQTVGIGMTNTAGIIARIGCSLRLPRSQPTPLVSRKRARPLQPLTNQQLPPRPLACRPRRRGLNRGRVLVLGPPRPLRPTEALVLRGSCKDHTEAHQAAEDLGNWGGGGQCCRHPSGERVCGRSQQRRSTHHTGQGEIFKGSRPAWNVCVSLY